MSSSLHAVTIDCANAALLARFWSQVLDQPVDPDPSEDFASIGPRDAASAAPRWMFNRVPEAKHAKNRVHPDLICAAHADEVNRILALGANRVADVDQDGTRWTTLTDPEGNEFDIIAEQP